MLKNRLRNFVACLTGCIISFSAAGQEFEVTGMVKDSVSGEAIISALINTGNGTKKTATNDEGLFSFKVPTGTYTVTVNVLGYKLWKKKINVKTQTQLIILLQEESNELETVVVSAGRYEQNLNEVSVSMTVLKPAIIENKNTVNCESILELVPSVTVQDGNVSIRGGSGYAYGAGSRVMLLVDDMPMLSGDAADIKFNALPVENIEQIEVIKGASSVLYGTSALNGVVNIRTAYPRETPETKIIINSGFYGNPKRDSIRWWDDNPFFHGATFIHKRKIGNLDLVVGGAYNSDRGYREGEEEHRGRGNVGLRWHSKKIKGLMYGVNANWQRARGGNFIIWQDSNNPYSPSGGANPDSAGSTIAFYNNDRGNLDPFITYYTSKGNKHSLRTRWFNTTNRNSTDTVDQASIADWLYAEYQYEHHFKKEWTLVSGLVSSYNLVRSALFGDHHGANVAVFTQLDKKWKRLSVSAGIRIEYFKLDSAGTVSTYSIIKGSDTINFPVQPVFRAGLNYKLFKGTFLRASFGQGYRYPSVAERYVQTSVGALKLFPNPNLEAETGWSAEVGVRQLFQTKRIKAYADVSAFINHYDNMTEFTFGVYNPPGYTWGSPGFYLFDWVGFRAENAEQAQITGFDAEIGATMKAGHWKFNGFVGYTYMNPITLNNDTNYRKTFSDTGTIMLKYRYRHLLKADLQVDYKILSFGVSVRYNSYMENVDNIFYNIVIPSPLGLLNLGDYLLPGFPEYRAQFNKGSLVIDFRLGIDLSQNTRMSIVANNVLNEEVMGRPGDVQAPRSFAVQYVLKF
ncbi:MAG: TonB-dependent receptor domain-containing protein [Flavobacteriales bacterium]